MPRRRSPASPAIATHVPERRARARLLAAAFAVALGGCGGGGGGPGGGTTSGVTLTLDPSHMVATVMETAAMPDQFVTGHASGDLASLNGKTIYVVVEDPASLFAGSSVTVMPTGAFTLQLQGKSLTAPGHYTGNLRIFVSLDQALTQQLGNSPLAVPYDVEVLPGLSVDTAQLTVATTFGDPAPTRAVKATLSPYTTSWYARWFTGSQLTTGCLGDGTYDTGGGAGLELIDCAPDGTVTITLEPQPPGNYSKTVRIQATVSYGGTTYAFSKEIAISYTVAANDSVEAVFYPPTMDVTRTAGDSLFEQANYLVVTNTGVASTWHPVEYLGNPAAADGHPQVNAWWIEYPYKGTSTCYNTISSSDCLPVGVYTARMHYTLTKDGVATEAYYPITLTIVP